MSNTSFGFDKPEESPGFLLWQVSITWQRLVKVALDPYALSHAQFVLLALLLWCEEAQQAPIQSFLVTKSKLDKMTVSVALKQLTHKGLVERYEHMHDTRAKLVRLTRKGRSLTKKVVPIVEAIDEKFFEVIKKPNQQLLNKILNKLASNPRVP